MTFGDPTRRIYLDHAATSYPKPPEVVAAAVAAIDEAGGNPGRAAHAFAVRADRVIADARGSIARMLGVRDARNLIFQPGCTAALNLVLFGSVQPGDRVVVSSMEHNAVVRPLHELARRGVEVVVAEADSRGALDPDAVEALVRQAPTRAVVVQHASNVTGAVQPIADLSDIAHAADALMVVDGAQAGGHLAVDLARLDVDAWACSGHKGLLGLQGTGVLALSERIDPMPLLWGGTGSSSESPEMPAQRPERYEAGTENVPGIAALAAAADVLSRTGEAQRAREQQLIGRLHEGLLGLGMNVLGPGPGELRVPLVSATHPAIDADRLAFELDRRFGIAVRAGLHCAAWAHRTCGTLDTGAVRFSVGHGITSDEIEATISAVDTIIQGETS